MQHWHTGQMQSFVELLRRLPNGCLTLSNCRETSRQKVAATSFLPQVRNAAFGFVPGRDWHNKNALTKRVAPVKDMSRVQLLMLFSQAGKSMVFHARHLLSLARSL